MLIRCGCVPSDCQKVSERPSRRRSTPLPGCVGKEKEGTQGEKMRCEVEREEKLVEGGKKKPTKWKTKKTLTLAVDTLHWASPPTSRSLVSSSGGLAVFLERAKRDGEGERESGV